MSDTLNEASSHSLRLSPTRQFQIRPAVRTPSNLMLGLVGPSGSGKTFSALRLATGLSEAAGGEIVLIDTENGRARAYADLFRFRHLDLTPPFGSIDYLDALKAVACAKPSVIIIDSLTHEHESEGGLLDFYSQELERLAEEDRLPYQRQHLAAWRRPKQARRQLLAGLLRFNAHIICCFRAAERTRMLDGQPELIDWGFTPIAGPEFIYELNVCALLHPGARGKPTWLSERPGEALAIKLPRPFESMFADGDVLSEVHGRKLGLWAHGGSVPVSRLKRRRARTASTMATPEGSS